MKNLGLLLLSFATVALPYSAHADHFCNISETVYLKELPFEIRNQVQGTKKYSVETWRDCYQRAQAAASAQDFKKTLTICQEGVCQDLTGPVFMGWYFWSTESLVTIDGKLTTYTWDFDGAILKGDRRFFEDGSMFP